MNDEVVDETRVCWTHGRVNVCRTGEKFPELGECEWRTDEAAVKLVQDYQLDRRHDWRDWQPGDPCGKCGSRRTKWGDADEGAVCLDCGSHDSDE